MRKFVNIAFSLIAATAILFLIIVCLIKEKCDLGDQDHGLLQDLTPIPVDSAQNADMLYCATMSVAIQATLKSATETADRAGLLQLLGNRTIDSLLACGSSEDVWYAMLLAAEHKGIRYPVNYDRQVINDFDALANEAIRQFPRTARIVTIYARHRRSDVGAAKAAYLLGSNYPPARVVFARSLLDQGLTKEALEILYEIREPSIVPEATALLVRASYKKGDYHQIIQLLKNYQENSKSPFEPQPYFESAREMQDIAKYAVLAYVQVKDYSSAASLLLEYTKKGYSGLTDELIITDLTEAAKQTLADTLQRMHSKHSNHADDRTIDIVIRRLRNIN